MARVVPLGRLEKKSTMTALLVALVIANPLAAPAAPLVPDHLHRWTQQFGVQGLELGPEGSRVIIYLPDDIQPGDKISGSVFGNGNTSGLTLDANGARTRVSDVLFSFDVPRNTDRVHLRLFDGDRMIAETSVIAAGQGMRFDTFHMSPVTQAGTAIEVVGPFDGDRLTTGARLDGRAAGVLTESPRACVISAPAGARGRTAVYVFEGGKVFESNVNVLHLSIRGPEGQVTARRQGQVAIDVDGLGGLEQEAFPISVVVVNENPAVIRFLGGQEDHAIVEVPYQQVEGGRWSGVAPFTALTRGSFGVHGYLFSEGYRRRVDR
jgi:hypothetical protein